MSQQTINVGTAPNTGDGDLLRVGGQKINANFTELYTGKQPLHVNLTQLAAIIGAADRLPYFTGVGALSVTVLNALGRSLIGAASTAAARTALQLGTSATHDLGTANGVASLGADGKLIPSQTPDMSINDVYPVNSQAAMLALPADRGDIAIRTDESNKPYILTTLPPSTLANWTPIGQTLPPALLALSGLSPAGDTIGYYTGTNTSALTVLNSLGRSIIGAANNAVIRGILGLSNSATMPALGTVSQSGGVPTGSIIERGSNVNGEYVRFADGTQICTYTTGAIAAVTVSGNAWISPNSNWTYPMAFAPGSEPVFMGMTNTANGYVGCSGPPSNTVAAWTRVVFFSDATARASRLLAIGRWY